jgi:hypothetical protein
MMTDDDAVGQYTAPYTRVVSESQLTARVATLEAALRTIQSAIPGYLKGEMTEHDFALLVLGEADSSTVNKALEKGR